MAKKKKNNNSKQNQPTTEDKPTTEDNSMLPQDEPSPGSEQSQQNTDDNPTPDVSRDTEPTADNTDGMNFKLQLPPAEVNPSSSEIWHTGREEDYATEVRVRTLFGRLECEGTEPSSVREKDIFRILELNEVRDVEALYKTSAQRFVLIFGSEDSALKCLDAELSFASGDERVSLVFRKRRRAPTFITMFLPEYISCQAVDLAFSNFGEVQTVFYGTHTFNRNIRNGKRHVRIFPNGGNPEILPRRITFSDGISRDVLYKGKLVNCYRCGTRHALGDSCAEVVCQNSDMTLAEQNNPPREPTPPPNTTAATNGTSAVADEHREVVPESNRSLPDPCETGANRYAPLALEEGEIESDSDYNVRQTNKDPSPSEMNHVLNILKQKLPGISKPKPEVFQWTLKNSSFKMNDRIEGHMVLTLTVKHYQSGRQSDLAVSLLKSAFSLIKARDYEDSMNFHFNYFNRKLDWNISIDEFETIIVHIFCWTYDLAFSNST